MTKTKSYLWIANLCAFIATVSINVIANVIPLGGYNTGQISAMYPTLFTPPGFTFGIWGAIYGLLGIFILLSIFSKAMKDTEAIGPYFIITCICNIAWIFTWHFQMIGFSFIAIAGLLLSLFKIYTLTRESGFITKTTFSMYYAWITVATIIATFVLIKTATGNAPVTPIEPRMGMTTFTQQEIYGDIMLIDDFTDPRVIIVGGDPEIASYASNFEYVAATIVALIVGALTVFHIYRYHDMVYALTILWAVGGIAYRQLSAPKPPSWMIVAAALAVIAIVYALIVTFVPKGKCEVSEDCRGIKNENIQM